MNATRRKGAGDVPALAESFSPISIEQVYHDYAPRVYSLARTMVPTEADAEDVTQDVLLQVVRKLPGFRGESALPTWLHRITVNAALTHRRKQAVRESPRVKDPLEARLEDGRHAERPTSAPPDARLMQGELKRLLDRAIAGLPEMYWEVFVLADLEGLPNTEIAGRL